MKIRFQNKMTWGSVVVAAALLAAVAKVQETTSQDRNVRITRLASVSEEDPAPHSSVHEIVSRASETPAVITSTALSRPVDGSSHGHVSAIAREPADSIAPPEKTRSSRAHRISGAPAVGSPAGIASVTPPAIEGGIDAALSQDIPGPILEEARLPVAVTIPEKELEKLGATEREKIREQLEDFQAVIDATSHLDVDDPAYFDAWKSAQRVHDQQLRNILGWDRFNRLSATAAAGSSGAP